MGWLVATGRVRGIVLRNLPGEGDSSESDSCQDEEDSRSESEWRRDRQVARDWWEDFQDEMQESGELFYE